MRNLRQGITYVNVVGTLALFLALSGGVVLAANKITSKQIGKGAVKNKNLAKNAVKAKNLAKKAVTAPKLANGAVKNAALADGAVNFTKLAGGTNVVMSTSTGVVPAAHEGVVAFNPPLSVTSAPGQVTTVHLEARGTLTANPGKQCGVVPFPEVNGNVRLTGALLGLQVSDPSTPSLPNGIQVADTSFPVGLTEPGVAQNIGLLTLAANCTPNSTLQVLAVVTQAK